MRMPQISNIFYADLGYRINGLFFKVHNQFGRYKNEKQYVDAFEGEFKKGNIKYAREEPLPQSFEEEKERRNI